MLAKAVIAVSMPIDEQSWYKEVPIKSRTRIISVCLYERHGRHPTVADADGPLNHWGVAKKLCAMRP